MMAGPSPADMTGGQWGIVETSFKVLPSFEINGTEAWIVWTSAQTLQMTTGRKKLRLKFTQPNGDVKAFPDLYITVQ